MIEQLSKHHKTSANSFFAVTQWSAEDAIAAAKAAGVDLSEEAAKKWWEQNQKRFADALTQYGNEVLSNVSWETVT